MAVVTEFDPKAFLAKIVNGVHTRERKAGDVIFVQGGKAASVFYIQSGRVKVTVRSEQKKEATVGVLESGQFFGEGCLNDGPVRMTTTRATIASVITEIPKAVMQKALATEPAFAQLFMAYLIRRNSRIEQDLMDHLFNSSEKRLARLLLLLAHFGTDDPPQVITEDINQEMLAEMIGATRQNVNKFMNKFRRLGLIKYNGHIEVNKALLNAVLHEKPEIGK